MESVKNFPIKKIVLASSGGTVYGEPEYLPIDEDHPLKPLSPYGITKVSLENYLYFYKKKYGIDYVVCRYSNPYGKYQNPLKKVGAINCFCISISVMKGLIYMGIHKRLFEIIFILMI